MTTAHSTSPPAELGTAAHLGADRRPVSDPEQPRVGWQRVARFRLRTPSRPGPRRGFGVERTTLSRRARRQTRPPSTGWVAIAGPSLTLLSVALLVFVAYVVALSAVEHSRSQRIAYAELRQELSALTAPVGQTDIDGRLLAPGVPVAYLTSAGLGLDREVVFEGTTSGVLAKGPGHRRSSVLPGQAGVSLLYGRSSAYSGPFGRVEDVRLGTQIRVTTGQGEHVYAVTGVRREGDPVPPVAPGAGRLTLVTATGSPFVPSGVVYVDAALTSPVVPAGPRVLTSAGLSPSEEALAGEPAAWPSVFLLMLGLATTCLGTAWASRRWGARQSWVVGFPLVGMFAALASREIVRLLPNLL